MAWTQSPVCSSSDFASPTILKLLMSGKVDTARTGNIVRHMVRMLPGYHQHAACSRWSRHPASVRSQSELRHGTIAGRLIPGETPWIACISICNGTYWRIERRPSHNEDPEIFARDHIVETCRKYPQHVQVPSRRSASGGVKRRVPSPHSRWIPPAKAVILNVQFALCLRNGIGRAELIIYSAKASQVIDPTVMRRMSERRRRNRCGQNYRSTQCFYASHHGSFLSVAPRFVNLVIGTPCWPGLKQFQ